MKAVHFGAGNIGRGFIGLLLSQAGYEVTFLDVNENLVNHLKQKREYPVVLASDQRETIIVRNVTGINSATETEAAVQAVAEADIITTAVGVNILKFIAPTIAEGLKKRLSSGSPAPLHIIACENAIGGSTQLKEHVYGLLDEATRSKADSLVAFPDAAVDRIVPLQQHDNPLEVEVEPFYEWAVDTSQMIPGYTPIEGIHYVDRLEPYIERKLFTVNTGHCSAAYRGYLKGYELIQQAMDDQQIADELYGVLKETGAVMVAKHGFDAAEHEAYIQKIMERFRNPALKDEVNRIGRSPIRKLSPNDRLVSPALQAFDRGLSYDGLAKSMAAALLFDVQEDPEAVQIQQTLNERGASETLTHFTGIPADHPVHLAAIKHYEQLKQAVK
ncbi:mannitol-1-phosphate 5-dehydrogenase [Paenibacillus physcomitrellae]|uniref:Mannitol-1-phosphate 5-dehydrogenase n=1 Tax=Paenibacillus physcomitrellae TaxID=1619311 RepID=A0ABQ1G8U1_9BACL|nr:mannitol-1-phosphate 5-dehydrogenase [Paenibacillus physcomitrellae]GGA38990.1 mannitol-1-phosphate 5-dehydrogenase [Paenibacillus physcomitrellae]